MSLNRLLEMQRANKDKQPDSGESAKTPPVVKAATVTQEPETPKPPEEPAPATPSKKLPFGNLGNKPKPTPAPTPKPAPKEELSLDNLGTFDVSSIDEPDTEVDPEFTGFIDEIEATAPDRDLPEEMTPGMLSFVESLDSIYLILNDTDMFAQSVRTIMMELQENPEYDKLISDTDVHVMIRAMRNTMGLARVKKQAKSRKTGTGKAKTPSRKQALMDKALALSVGIPGMDVD